MKFTRIFNFSTLVVVAVAFVSTCSAGDDPNRSEKDIPGVAIENGSFTTLVAALSATNLVGAISSPAGPFTVFAPTDEAFDALPNGLVECLLQDDNLPILSNILLYHVANGEALSTDLSNGMEIPTLLPGEEVAVDLSNNGGGVKINDATVVGADVLASNGVIHVLNQVLVPPSVDVGAFLQTCSTTDAASSSSSSSSSSLVDIPTTAINAGIFSTLVAALSATDLVGAVSEPAGPLTVFAPTDEAFTALPTGLVSCLLEEQNLPILSDILLYHVAAGTVFSTDLSNGQQLSTLLDGEVVTADLNNGVKINKSNVVGADVQASNGVIHIIDAVLLPLRIDVDAFLQTCGRSNDESSSDAVPPPPNHSTTTTTNDSCVYLGVQRSAGQMLVGPTHTCVCTIGGAWTQCRTNQEMGGTSLKTIEQVVLDSPDFTTLTAAIVQADLVGVLGDPTTGPFTLFAPTDTAFDEVPPAVLQYLLEDANQATLGEVLSYHVTRGRIPAAAIPEGSMTTVDTLLGNNDQIAVSKTCYSATNIEAGQAACGDNYSVLLDNTSHVIATDIQTSNGIIHVITKILIPPSLRDAVAGLVGN